MPETGDERRMKISHLEKARGRGLSLGVEMKRY
jgi:hypothetical protein